jgi:(2Fe-2S) ferredoxin
MPTLSRHVFICVNERAPTNPKGCCKHKGGEQVRAQFKKRLTDLGLKGVVRANTAGCLDQCEHGVTVVVYPEQVWYGGVTVDDVQEIVDRHVLGGEFVERLMIPDQPHLAGSRRAEPLDHPVARAAGAASDEPGHKEG